MACVPVWVWAVQRSTHNDSYICLTSFSCFSPVPCPYPTFFSFPTFPHLITAECPLEHHLYAFQWLSLLNHLSSPSHHLPFIIGTSVFCTCSLPLPDLLLFPHLPPPHYYSVSPLERHHFTFQWSSLLNHLATKSFITILY